MATIRFSKADFERILGEVCSQHDLSYTAKGLFAGEHRYQVIVKHFQANNSYVQAEIASSVDASGFAADTGENSIRVWLSGSDGMPMGNKLQKWATRSAGWESRFSDILNKVIELGSSLEYCNKCRTVEKVFIVKKEGKNHGRFFVKCACPNSFSWLDEYDQPDDPKPAKADASPLCPKCGGMMSLRSGRNGDFWSCRMYPACKGTRNVTADQDQAYKERTGRKPEVEFNYDWLEWKGKYQELEKEQEKAAFLSDPDYQAAQAAKLDSKATNLAKLVQDMLSKKAAVAADVADATPAKAFVPSKYQQPILDAVEAAVAAKKPLRLVVKARAGSGKTSTGVQMLNRLPKTMDIVFWAYNKRIATELGKRVPTYVKVSTTHSAGYAVCRQAFGQNIIIDENKVKTILEIVLDKFTYGDLYAPITDLVSLVKAHMMSTEPEDLDWIAEHHNVELNGDREVIYKAVELVLASCAKMTTVIDYDDMLWLPVYLDLPCPKHDVIFVDEAQDLNQNQIQFILKSVKATSTVVCVGDDWQSIYGFRGADIDAIPNLIQGLGAEEKPLSITYRNPKCVVDLVNEKFPEIGLEAADWAIPGAVRTISMNNAADEWKPGDMVLCRTNAPLVAPAFELIRKGIKAVIVGKDIGKGLVTLVNKMKANSMPDLMEKLAVYRDAERTKLLKAEKTGQAQALDDKVDTIIALADGESTITGLLTKIGMVFAEDAEGVAFSSVHKAKGLEAERVYILHRELMPHPMASADWEIIQERHIEYVAITRTLNELVYVTD